MRKVLLTFAAAIATTTVAFAGVWETQCVGCHNGTLAPSKQQLEAKFKNAKEFIKAAKKSNNPMMTAIKNNDTALKQAAKELFSK